MQGSDFCLYLDTVAGFLPRLGDTKPRCVMFSETCIAASRNVDIHTCPRACLGVADLHENATRCAGEAEGDENARESPDRQATHM